MILTNEDLLAISQLLDVKLKAELKPLREDIRVLTEKVQALEERVGSLEERVQSLEERVQSLEERMQSMEERMLALEERVQSLEERMLALEKEMRSVKQELHAMRSVQESVIIPRLNTIESCYMDTYERYRIYADKIEASFDDIDIMKKVIIGHSEKLQKLA